METKVSIYRNKINSYLLQLNEVNLQDASCALMWFYRIKDANIMFETYEVSDYVYNKLISVGYDVIERLEEEREVIKLINGNSENGNKNILARRIISLILKKLKNHESLDLATISLIEIFNETYNKEAAFSYMMNCLHENLESRITFHIIKDGEFSLITGILNDVDDYCSITVEGVVYPFIAVNIGIRKITTISGNVLYNNAWLNNHVNLNNKEEVKQLENQIFKDRYGQEGSKVI